MGARAVRLCKQPGSSRPVELTLAVPRRCPISLPDPLSFGYRLRQNRMERGWRQVDLANAPGPHTDTGRNWEAGRGKPRLEILGAKGAGIIRALYQSGPASGSGR